MIGVRCSDIVTKTPTDLAHYGKNQVNKPSGKKGKKMRKPVVVRVHLNHNISCDDRYDYIVDKSGNTNKLFAGLNISYYLGRFYIDTINGVVPEVFEEFLDNFFTIFIPMNSIEHEKYLSGKYATDEYPLANGEISGSKGLEIFGEKLEDVMGLYHAIVNNELAPKSVGLTVAELLANNEYLQNELYTLRPQVVGLKDRIKILELYIDLDKKNIDRLLDMIYAPLYKIIWRRLRARA